MGEGAKGDAFFAGEWGIVVFFEEKMREGFCVFLKRDGQKGREKRL